MVAEGGYGSLNVDVLAERAGVAKTTVYRRWPSKSALIAALLPPPGDYANAEAVLHDAQTLLEQLGDDPDVLDAIRTILRARRPALAALLGEGRADELLGAILMRLFVNA